MGKLLLQRRYVNSKLSFLQVVVSGNITEHRGVDAPFNALLLAFECHWEGVSHTIEIIICSCTQTIN